ncbi:MAG TPA: zinc ribbon domain-containing protein [Mycobacteriales bacterium]|jgi:putative FmdB family regulatory protein|nr:zinc ribbon domain-containing protein [Mycobacteriales bacterium]
MASYVYRCSSDGAFDVHRPLGQAPGCTACPACGGAARRVFTAPLLGRLDAGVVRAYDAAARSAHSPAIVSAPPGLHVPPQRPTLNPSSHRLPRP